MGQTESKLSSRERAAEKEVQTNDEEEEEERVTNAEDIGVQDGLILDPLVLNSLQKMFPCGSGRSLNLEETFHTDESEQTSSLTNAFGEEVTNPSCAYGHIRFFNGAVFQGRICAKENEAIAEETQKPASFLTSQQECVHGIWKFEGFQFDYTSMSPVASYVLLNGKVLCHDGSVISYDGPVALQLNLGVVVLKLRRRILLPPNDKEDALDNSEEVFLMKYPLHSPEESSRKELLRRQTTHRGLDGKPVKIDHRMVFWNLCGKKMAPSKWDAVINSDLKRTHFHRFVDRSARVASEQCFSILKYLSMAFPAVGYCQGMHCIAKFLLMFTEAPATDSPVASTRQRRGSSIDVIIDGSVSLESERAFVLFAQLFEDERYKFQSLFEPELKFYRKVLEDIDDQIAAQEPDLFVHLESLGLRAILYASKWILTLFTFFVDQDFSSVTNVWLRFLSRGWDALIEIAVACVRSVKSHLMKGDAEDCLLLLSGTTPATPHGILEVVFGTKHGQTLLHAPTKFRPIFRNRQNSVP